MMFRLLALAFLVFVSVNAEARTCSGFWEGYHPYIAYAEDVRAIDAALPCTNIVGGDPDSLAPFRVTATLNAGVYNAIARRNENEMNCRSGYYGRMLSGDRDQLLGAAIDSFNKLRPQFQRSRNLINSTSQEYITRMMGDRGTFALASERREAQREELKAEDAKFATGVPFGFEPDVYDALLKLEKELPADFATRPEWVDYFETVYRNALIKTQNRYGNGARYLYGKFRNVTTKNPQTGADVVIGGGYEESDEVWDAFTRAGSVEDLATDLQRAARPISELTASRMVCTTEMVHGEGPKTAETTVATGVGVGALVTGPAAPFIEAGIAAYYTKQMIQQCFFTPDIDVVKGQSCVQTGTIEGAIEAANRSRCTDAILPAALSVGGAALSFKLTFNILRNAEGKIIGLTPKGGAAELAGAALRPGAGEAAEEVGEIIATATLSRSQWTRRGTTLAKNISRGEGRAEALAQAGYSARSGAPQGFQKYCTDSGFCLTLPKDNRPLSNSMRRDLADAYGRRADGNREWVHPDARGGVAPPSSGRGTAAGADPADSAASTQPPTARTSAADSESVAASGQPRSAPTAPSTQALSETERVSAQESLRAKGITEENFDSFFNRANPTPLEPQERIYLFEQYSGLRVGKADADKLKALHEIGDGYGRYTVPQLRQKAEGIRDILRSNGITDPDEIRRIIDVSMRQGVFGRVPAEERRGIIAWLRARFGGGSSEVAGARPAGVGRPIPTTERPFAYVYGVPRSTRLREAAGIAPANRADRALNAQLATARQTYKETGREVVDSAGAGSRAALARRIHASDTFGGSGTFSGNMDELVRTRFYDNADAYESLGGYGRWWEKKSFSGNQSFSPIRQAADKAEEGVTYERNVFWQRDQLEANKQRTLSYQTAFERFGIAENVVIRNGKRELESVEVLVRRENGTVEPLYYVRDPRTGEMALARTFKGEPVERACIKCHHNPAGNPNVLTQLPYAALRGRGVEGLAPGYQAPAQRIAQAEGITPPPASGQPPPSAATVTARNNTASFPRNRNGYITDLDQQREAIEIVTGRPVTGPYRSAVNRVSDVQLRGGLDDAGKALERYNLLRFGKSTEEVAAYRAANGGSNPPAVFSVSDIDGMRSANIVGDIAVPTRAESVASVGAVATRAAPRSSMALGERLGESGRFVHVKGRTSQPLNRDVFVAGKTYTTLERNGTIIIGEDIGEGGTTAGTHLELANRTANSFPIDQKAMAATGDYNITRGGAIRVNRDGSVDVSGFHNQCIAPAECERAMRTMVEAFESQGVKVRLATPDRLPPDPSAPAPVVRSASAPRPTGPAPTDTRSLGSSLGRSSEFEFVQAGSGRRTLDATTLQPGKSYVTLEHDGKIVIGENFVGPTGTTSNSHITLANTIGHDMTMPAGGGIPYRGGSIRANADGSVDVSGYHGQGMSPKACEEAALKIATALRSAGVRVRVVTPDRLPPPSQ